MKSKLLFVLMFPLSCWAQLYTEASNNLPNNGAQSQTMDVQAADLDGDGDLDIVLANEFQANTILINDGSGIFTNTTNGNLPQRVQDSEDVAIADFNGDGYLDLVFCSEDDVVLGESNVHEYYTGDGMGNFMNADFQLPDTEANAVTAVDINNDGFVDLFFGNNGATGVLMNNGNGIFNLETERVPAIAKTTQDLTFADIDADGDLDLFEGNEDGNRLYLNDGEGYFTDETATRLPQGLNIETRKVTFGDVDGDGDLDAFLSNVVFIAGKDPQNRLFLNDGIGVFTDVTSTRLPADTDHTVDAIFVDVDLDQDLDLIVCNVFGAPIKVYENDGLGSFANNTVDILGQLYFRDALGVIAEDFNGDGLKDIYVCDRRTPATNNKDVLLIRNSTINSIQFSQERTTDIMVSPNPNHGFFTIDFINGIPDTIVVTNSNGEKIQSFDVESDSIHINLSTLPNGTYLLVAQYNNQKRLIKKIIMD